MKKIINISMVLTLLTLTFYSNAYANDLKVLVNYTSSAESRYIGDGSQIQLSPRTSHRVCQSIGPFVDCYSVYEPARMIASALKTRIDSMFAEANQGYANSGINIRLIPVGYYKYDTSSNQMVQYSDVLHYQRDKTLINRRNKYNADLVTVLTLKNRSFCGNGIQAHITTGYTLNDVWAHATYSSVAMDCALNFALGHEISHNLGLGHSAKQNLYGSFYRFGTGYGVDNVFSTVMAYDSFGAAVRVNKFSSPNLICDNSGLKCGIFNEADSVLAINKIAQLASMLGENCNLYINSTTFRPESVCNNKMTLPK